GTNLGKLLPEFQSYARMIYQKLPVLLHLSIQAGALWETTGLGVGRITNPAKCNP
ncbi:MAG: hypothetical protein ACI8YI_002366, partial [Paracoccaceae bacterium]